MVLILWSCMYKQQPFYPVDEDFTKNKDKIGWVKYWQMIYNSPNSPKFSPTRILRYMVLSFLPGLCLTTAIRQL